MRFLFAIMLVGWSGLGGGAEPLVYGQRPSEGPRTPLVVAQRDFDKFQGQPIRVVGQVARVCEQKGCWLELESEGAAVRVRFEGYSFFVPKTLLNRQVLVQGKLNRRELSVREQRHYLADAGADQAAIDAVSHAKHAFELTASGLKALP